MVFEKIFRCSYLQIYIKSRILCAETSKFAFLRFCFSIISERFFISRQIFFAKPELFFPFL